MTSSSDQVKRFSFKTNVKYDIALLTEVESLNPFASKKKSKDAKKVWEEISQNLSNCHLQMKVTDRSCRERCDLLLKEFAKDESLSYRSSGIDEDELGEVQTLLTSIKKLSETPPLESLKKLYAKTSRNAAEKERLAALATLEEGDDGFNQSEDNEVDVTDGEDANHDNNDGEKNAIKNEPEICTPKRLRKGDVVEFLDKKHKGEMNIRCKELEVRRYEAENQRMQIEMEKTKQELEHKARMEELQIRKETEAAQNEEKLTMTKAILELLQRK